MKRIRLLLIVLLALLALAALPVLAQDEAPAKTGLRPDAPPYGVRGPYSVGVMDTGLDNPDRPLPVTIWYPALGEEAELNYGPFGALPLDGKGIINGAPDASGAPYPLVILSHGLWVNRSVTQWLTEHLASYGFVVIAPEHQGSSLEDYVEMASDPNAAPEVFTREIAAYAQRPLDIPLVIDFAATLTARSGALAGMIDLERVAVSGASFGGYTALAAGGAQLDMTSLQTWCDANPDEIEAFTLWGMPVMDCSAVLRQAEIAAAAGLESVPQGLWPSLGDPRVDAVIALSPGMVLSFGEDGLANVSVPALVIGATADSITPVENNALRAFENLGSTDKSLVVFENADHFLVTTNKTNAAVLAMGIFWADPVWDMDRAHDITDHLVTAFLLDVLKGDAEAHAALLAGNVSFPGVTYETTMK